jgi:TrmH family RNA methyltransferase
VPDQPDLDRLNIVLVSPRNPLNIGAAARSMSNFGFQRLRVVNPYDLAFREARSAVGASELLANAAEFKSVADGIADCSLVVGTTAIGKREVQHPVFTLSDAAQMIHSRLAFGNVALLFGSEKRGLSNEDLSHCHWLLRIPTRPEHRSMNLGQAVAVCLYELVRDSGPVLPRPIHEAPAGSAEIERIVAILLEALNSSGYTTPDRAPITEEKLRRMAHRLSFSAVDSEVLTGMLRKILWKLQHGEQSSSGQ